MVTDTAETDIQNNTQENKVESMNVQVGDVVFSATLEGNEAVSALVEMMRESPWYCSLLCCNRPFHFTLAETNVTCVQ